ncbi:hypothetical protein BMW23_1030 [Bodo saltans virus]|uniref:Uncharacterized protein n=1 Tax=Bodo saltans virus TaxID=2024608 RepID=A0A2H4UW60_9VIRU|nr:hypothetical protein QJ851_gp1012 [Bodo saltans virus]ATZ81075.1 hypothetical protein BMW23_1030 [Bodo saltans virus]
MHNYAKKITFNYTKQLKKYVEQITYETGTLYDIAIILSKCNIPISDIKIKSKIKAEINEYGEIEDDDEDTNLIDIIEKVKEKFPNKNIMLFNAYGRVYYNKSTSLKFKNFVSKMCGNLTDNNTRFSISKFCKSYPIRQEKEYCKCFEKNYNEYLTNKIKIDDIMKYFEKLNDDNRIKYTLQNTVIVNNNFDYKKYKFVNSIITKYPSIYESNNDNITIMLLLFLINIMHTNKFDITQNLVETYNLNKLQDVLIKLFKKLSCNVQQDMFEDIIFKNSIQLTNMNCAIIYHLWSNIYLKKNDIPDDFKYNRCIEYEFNILKENIIIVINNIVFDSAKIYKTITDKFKNLSFCIQEKIIDNIIFKNTFDLTQESRIEILKNNLDKDTWIEKYNFKTKFNEFVLNTTDLDSFQKMSNMMIQYCGVYMEQYKFVKKLYKYCGLCNHDVQNDTTKIERRREIVNGKNVNGIIVLDDNHIKCPLVQHQHEMHKLQNAYIIEIVSKTEENYILVINKFLDIYEKMINDEMFLITNKLQILNNIFINNESYTFDFRMLYCAYLNVAYNDKSTQFKRRIILTKEFIELSNKMFNNIYSKPMINCTDMTQFCPLDKSELLFNM